MFTKNEDWSYGQTKEEFWLFSLKKNAKLREVLKAISIFSSQIGSNYSNACTTLKN